jgi:glycosyltransferase involved in cell wall biosynthesis
MRILHVITSLRTGGAEKLMVDLLPRLKEKGCEVDLLLFDGTETPFRRQVEAAGIHVMHTRIGGSVYNPLNLIKLIPYLRRYDIVHTHNTAPQLFAAIVGLVGKATLVTTEHNTSNRRRSMKWYAPIDRWMYNRYKQVICISEKAQETLRAFIGKSKADICTINNGVDISKFANAEPSDELQQIAPRCKSITMVAGFRWEKDQDTLIKGMALLDADFHLFLVGDGVRRGECEQLVKENSVADRVHFMGLRTDVPNLLRASDYVVMSSHFEGLSLSSVEGMSVGKPFLSSNVNGLREVVEGAGLLFEHQDAEGFAKLIKQLDADAELYHTVAARCRERAKQFDISKMVDGYYKVYQALVGNDEDN